MREKALTAAVFTVSLVVLAWNAGAPGFATSYVDPIGKIPAQDEAVYASTSLEMAGQLGTVHNWMTPRFLGRLALYKPPVLYWLSAASVKLLGESPRNRLGRSAFAIRLPSILAGAVTVTLIFSMLRVGLPLAGALAGAILLLSSHLFFVMSRVGLTDALLTLEITIAMYALTHDPRLASRGWMWVFGTASGAAIMTKSTAGLFPLLILGGFWLVAVCTKSQDRPSVGRMFQVVAITAAVALPWHLWQLAIHPRWFWNEYIMTEQLSWGLGAKSQSTQETHGGYYLKRLLLLDPILAVAAVVALFKTRPRLPLVWIAIILLGCAAFQYRNTSYLLPVYPALALTVATSVPSRYARALLAGAAVLFAAKSAMPESPWGIPFAAESVNPSHAALDSYLTLHRVNTLIIVEPDDQFYSSDLDLARVRYVYLDPTLEPLGVEAKEVPLDFRKLGITVTVEEFERLPELRAVFKQRLHEWNLDSDEAVATVILARDETAIRNLIASDRNDDFFVPARFSESESHRLTRAFGSRVLLLSREKVQRP